MKIVNFGILFSMKNRSNVSAKLSQKVARHVILGNNKKKTNYNYSYALLGLTARGTILA